MAHPYPHSNPQQTYVSTYDWRTKSIFSQSVIQSYVDTQTCCEIECAGRRTIPLMLFYVFVYNKKEEEETTKSKRCTKIQISTMKSYLYLIILFFSATQQMLIQLITTQLKYYKLIQIRKNKAN